MTGYPKAEINPKGLKTLMESIEKGEISREPSRYTIMTKLRGAGIPIEYGPAGSYRKAIKDNLWTIRK